MRRVKKQFKELNFKFEIEKVLPLLVLCKGSKVESKELLKKCLKETKLFTENELRVINSIIEPITDLESIQRDIDIDTLNEIYEEFLTKKNITNQLIEVYTREKVSKLMSDLLFSDIQNENKKQFNIIDFASGIGYLLRTSFNLLREKGLENKLNYLIGQDINLYSNILAKINLVLADIPKEKIKIFHNDTLLNIEEIEEITKGENTDNRVIINPPFNLKGYTDKLIKLKNRKWSKIFKFGLTKNNADWLFIQIAHYLSTKRYVVLIDNSILTRSNKREFEIRKKFVENNLIEKVISLPNDIFLTTKVSSVILVFNKEKQTNEIEFIDLSDLTYEDLPQSYDELKERFKDKITIKSIEKIRDSNYNLSPKYYIGITQFFEDIDTEEVLNQLFKDFEKLIELHKREMELKEKVFSVFKSLKELRK